MHTRESIHTKTMRRVMTVYYLRKVLNMTMLKVGVLVLGGFAFGSLVHVAAVLANMPSIGDIGSLYNFSYNAFLEAESVVQGLVVALGLVTLWLLRDILRGFLPKLHVGYSHA